MIMVYKDDVIQALESYVDYMKSRDLYFDGSMFSQHYCKKYGLAYNRYRKKIEKDKENQ